MTDSVASFIDQLDIGSPPFRPLDAQTLPQLTGEGEEGAVVSQHVVSFDSTIPTATRNDVSNWMLLAQLVADQTVSDKSNVADWMDVYLGTLADSGWTWTTKGLSYSENEITGATVHEEIIKLLPVLLGPASTVLALATAALTTLGDMDKDSPWITLFDRRARDATAVGFQVVGCKLESGGAVGLEGGDFLVRAERVLTKVLFFSFESGRGQVMSRQARLSLSDESRATYSQAVREKVREWVLGEIAAFPLPDRPPRT
jgi:hypothetical protein